MGKYVYVRDGWNELPENYAYDRNGKVWTMRSGWDPTDVGETRGTVKSLGRDIVKSRDFNFDLHEREPGYVPFKALHSHPIREEMFIVFEGEGKGIINNRGVDREIELIPGTVVYIPVRCRHHFQMLATPTNDKPIRLMELGTGEPVVVAHPNAQMDLYVGLEAQEECEEMIRRIKPEPFYDLLDRVCFEDPDYVKESPDTVYIRNGWEELPLRTLTDANGKKWSMHMGFDPSGNGYELFKSQDFNIILHEREAGYEAPKFEHYHTLREEMFIVLDGNGKAEIDGKELELIQGSMIYFPAGQPHYPLAAAVSTTDKPIRLVEIGSGCRVLEADPTAVSTVFLGKETALAGYEAFKKAVPPMDDELGFLCWQNSPQE